MQGRFFDGLAPISRPAQVEVERDALLIRLGEEALRWRLDELEAEPLGTDVRLRPGPDRPERLVLPQADWKAVRGSNAGAGRIQRRRERRLVAALALVAVGMTGFV